MIRVTFIRSLTLLLIPVLLVSSAQVSFATESRASAPASGALFWTQALSLQHGGAQFFPALNPHVQAKSLKILQVAKKPVVLSLSVTATVLILLWWFDPTLANGLLGAFIVGMATMGPGMNLSLHGNQSYQYSQILRQDLVQSRLGSYLRWEAFMVRLWDKAAQHRQLKNVDVNLLNPQMEIHFSYVVIDDVELTPMEKKMFQALIQEKGPVFSHVLFDSWPSVRGSGYGLKRGRGLIFVQKDLFSEFEKDVAVNEWGKMVSAGNDHLGMSLAIRVALQEHRLAGYLNICFQALPEKLTDLYAQPTSDTSSPLDPEFQDFISARSEQMDFALQQHLESFQWPAAARNQLTTFVNADAALQKILLASAEAINEKLKTVPTDSPSAWLIDADKLVRKIFLNVVKKKFSDTLRFVSKRGLNRAWKNACVILSGFYDRRLDEYARLVGRDSDAYLALEDKTNLLDYGAFSETAESLLNPDQELLPGSAHDSLDQRADTLITLLSTKEWTKIPEPSQLAMLYSIGSLTNQVGISQRGKIITRLCTLLSETNLSSDVRNAILVAMSDIRRVLRDAETSVQLLSFFELALTSDPNVHIRIDAAYLLMELAPVEYVDTIAAQLNLDGTKPFKWAILQLLADRTNYLTTEEFTVYEDLKTFEAAESDSDLKAMAAEVLRRIQDNTSRAQKIVYRNTKTTSKNVGTESKLESAA